MGELRQMAKKAKPKPRKGAKRGPKEERLYIPDIEAALDKLLKPRKSPLDAALKRGRQQQALDAV